MKYRVLFVLSFLAFALALLAPAQAHAGCMGAPDGKCDPGTEDCACDDCLKACSGECTGSNPPACTLEDACTCSECWTDPGCTDPDKKNCEDDSMCDFFTEGCCCADCAALAQCTAFNGDCGDGAGGTGGGVTGGSGGGGGAGGLSSTSGGTGGTGAGGGSGGLTVPRTDCGCTVAGAPGGLDLSFCAAVIGAALFVRRRRPAGAALFVRRRRPAGAARGTQKPRRGP